MQLHLMVKFGGGTSAPKALPKSALVSSIPNSSTNTLNNVVASTSRKVFKWKLTP